MSSCDFRKEQSNDTSPTTDAETDQITHVAYLCFDITFSSTVNSLHRLHFQVYFTSFLAFSLKYGIWLSFT